MNELAWWRAINRDPFLAAEGLFSDFERQS